METLPLLGSTNTMEKFGIDELFRVAVANKARIVRGFIVFYGFLLVFLFVGGRSIYLGDSFSPIFYQWGVWFGRIALLLYCITLIPGMTKRFRLTHKLFSLIRIFRRYIGISVFLFALTHASFVRFIPLLASGVIVPGPAFQTFGLISLALMFFMFLTSNDFSVNRLGLWWYRLHWVTHIIMITAFFHTLLQRVSVWSVLIGIIVVAQLASFIVAFNRKSS